MVSPTGNPEMNTLAEVGFLLPFYTEAGVSLDTELTLPRGDRFLRSERVAHDLMDLLHEGVYEFPTLEVPDTTGKIFIPTQIKPRSFDQVQRTSLLPKNKKATTGYESLIDVLSPYPDMPNMCATLGYLTVGQSPNGSNYVESVQLPRGDGSSFGLHEQTAIIEDSVEAMVFLGLVQDYLNRFKRL